MWWWWEFDDETAIKLISSLYGCTGREEQKLPRPEWAGPLLGFLVSGVGEDGTKCCNDEPGMIP